MLRRTLIVFIAIATLGTALVVSAAPSNAAAIVSCDSWPAPSIGSVDANLTAHYYHSCSSLNGVTRMTGRLYIENRDVYGAEDDWTVVSAPQMTAASTRSVGHTGTTLFPHGYYRATEELYIYGTFTYGPPPHGGCGRVSSTEVYCFWASGYRFF
jgi:hypothetical protein